MAMGDGGANEGMYPIHAVLECVFCSRVIGSTRIQFKSQDANMCFAYV
jgi:hypothetical protein